MTIVRRIAMGIALAAASGVVESASAQAPASQDGATDSIQLGATPLLIGEGTISTPAEEFKATVSPDGRTLLYTVTGHRFRHMTIVEAEHVRGKWMTPTVAPFSGTWRDGDPSFAPDGKTVLFISNRPLPGDSVGTVRRDFNIWFVTRRPNGAWSDPVAFGRAINTDTAEFSPSMTASGTLYFSRGEHMFRAERHGAGYATPVPLPIAGGDPAISPDERFIVMDADGSTPGDSDLFLSCRTDGGWSVPRRLASPVSSSAEDGDPSIDASGRTLYFFSRRAPRALDRAPRAHRATYAEVEREALDDVYNGSRNLYEVMLPTSLCSPARP